MDDSAIPAIGIGLELTSAQPFYGLRPGVCRCRMLP